MNTKQVISILLFGLMITLTVVGTKPVMGYFTVPIQMPPAGYNTSQILCWNIGQILLHRLGLVTITRDNVSHTQTEYIASNSTIANSIERTLLQPIEQTMQNSTKLTQNQKTYELHYVQELRKTMFSPTYSSKEIGRHMYTQSIAPAIKKHINQKSLV
jgi:hypothetical protein